MNTTNYTNDTVSLNDALSNQNTSGRPVKIFVGYNIGYRTFTINLSLFELQELTEVANDQTKGAVTQRKLDSNHAMGIGRYILKGLVNAAKKTRQNQGKPVLKAFDDIEQNLGIQPYLSIPPLIASFRNSQPNGTNLMVKPLQTIEGETGSFKIFVNPGDTFWIVDGQHRRMGLHYAHEFLKTIITTNKYASRGSLYKSSNKDVNSEEMQVWSDCFEMLRLCTVAVEVHLGLTVEQERQLFHDLNNLGKKVDKSLALNFDGSNPINSFIGDVLMDELFFDNEMPVINNKEKGDWKDKGLTRQELVSVNARLFLNSGNINGAIPSEIDPKKIIAKNFWESVLKIQDFTSENPKLVTVSAQPVVLKALAKLVYDFCFGKNKEWANKVNCKKIMDGINEIDFTHDNPMWRYYTLTSEERISHGLENLKDYLPNEDEGANRDLGAFDEQAGTFRFGAKHNDIYPILGDMIRWKLGLPSRKKIIEPGLFE